MWNLKIDFGTIFWDILTLHPHNSKSSLPTNGTFRYVESHIASFLSLPEHYSNQNRMDGGCGPHLNNLEKASMKQPLNSHETATKQPWNSHEASCIRIYFAATIHPWNILIASFIFWHAIHIHWPFNFHFYGPSLWYRFDQCTYISYHLFDDKIKLYSTPHFIQCQTHPYFVSQVSITNTFALWYRLDQCTYISYSYTH